MKRRLLALIVVFCTVALLPRVASAQFDTPNRSFHNAAAFRLDGRHQALACESCHLNGQYKSTPNTCYDCHWIRRKDDRFQTRLGSQCEQCHRPTSWSAVQWNHAAQSGVTLNQEHRQLACESCHRGATFNAASVTCVNCHQKDYSSTTAPNHAAAGFAATCDVCHRPGDSTWRNTGAGGFSHNAVFPLAGVHAAQACSACHKNNFYMGTPRDCIGCHQAQYNATRNPPHASAGFGTTCDACHRPTDAQWPGAMFNHSSVFSLVGRHAGSACASCHVNNVYRGTPRDCIGCHQAQYNATRNPPHASAGFGTTCGACHKATDTSWQQATFSHTRFPLSGRHNVACAQCHTTPSQYAVFSCTVCHGRSEADKDHKGRNGYVYNSNACYSCHPTGRD